MTEQPIDRDEVVDLAAALTQHRRTTDGVVAQHLETLRDRFIEAAYAPPQADPEPPAPEPPAPVRTRRTRRTSTTKKEQHHG